MWHHARVDLEGLAGLDYCYLVTTGRKTGQPREIEIWFGLQGRTLYLLSGGGERSHWVRNIAADPAVRVRLDGRWFAATGRRVAPGMPEDRAARDLVFAKYQAGYSGDLTDWRERALVMAIDLRDDEAEFAS
ncbi:MAG: nitroreductase family deazaflavin-dependent oxidoreductase [Dehalococcoidia bacterium]|nr:nitroreductase family deazaflavin-dependent oxidoreductase [Dehalococcoidia bacterium]